ncbi:hypothetical protein ALI144C_06240 [Actinosynnema sp. ALI-1.44]|uniref:hypothetical protein n=1 Tax=Actinosynnema sp. ALI-1.44 TaxID=1933779 RepID=UPI00097C737C|nr:hypothetical protein [Actinosynnema sp. ALI-1.44]ONI88628.1 hypothetical protein ALI144C_06240 [Actinosynnema sp. ALI-1.44]
MITGVDTVLLTAGRAGPAIGRFLEQWGRVWPDMRISAGDPAQTPFVTWQDARSDIPETCGEVLVAKDERMLSDWDDHGYEIPGSAVGPFALLYQPCQAPRFEALVQHDPYARGLPFDPYPVIVVATDLSLITIVTPDGDSEFSQSVINGVIAALVQQEGQPAP